MQTALRCDNTISCANIMAVIKDFVVSKEINTWLQVKTDLSCLTCLLL